MSLDIYLGAWVHTGITDENGDGKGNEWHSFDDGFNATHNLIPMWSLAGCYESLYESDGKTAESILPALREAEAAMMADEAAYRALEPENGWGSYAGALRFLGNVIRACNRRPLATIRVSR